VQGREQETELVLECVEVRDGRVGQVGSLEDEALSNVAAATKVIEDNQVANEVAIGGPLKHRSNVDRFCHDCCSLMGIFHGSAFCERVFRGADMAGFRAESRARHPVFKAIAVVAGRFSVP
jgi:hypothetical protein